MGCAALVAGVATGLLRTRVSRPFVLAWLPLAALLASATAWVGRVAGEDERHRLQSLVEGMGPTYALELEGHGHARIGLDTPPDDPLYLELVELEKRWLAANPAMADVYTFRRLDDGTVVLLVDAETDYDRDGRYEGERESRTAIGEVYPEEDVEDTLRAAFDGRAGFLSVPVTDRWGTWVSAFVPLHDAAGAVEGVVGVDFPAADWERAIDGAVATRLVVGASLLVLVGVAFLIAGQALGERRRRAEEVTRLEAALRGAEAATAARTDLLRTVSHEIRNPLNGVIGMAELLLETELDPDQRHCAETVHRSGQLLLQTLDGVLDFAKLEAGAMVFSSEPTDVRELAALVVQLFGEAARRKKLEIYAHVEPDVPDRARMDATRVRLVLVNLVANAVKFTSAGEVELRVARRGAGALAFAVRDTGVGIPADRIARLFAPFEQADGAETHRRFGGSGLGLFIGRRLGEGMGGTLGVDSHAGQGSTFTLTLPAPAEPDDEGRRGSLRGRTLLVLEPHPRAGEAVGAALAALGARAIVASNVRAAEGAAVAHRPDLVLVEASALDAVQASSVLQRRKLVAMTARPLGGYDGPVLHKPVGLPELRRLTEQLGTPAPRRERTAVPISVLLLEPNVVNQGVVTTLFRRSGAGVEACASAAEAGAVLGRAPFDLVLVGPSVDEGEAAALLAAARAVARAQELPVVSVGGHAGVDGHLGWPLRPDGVEEMFRRYVPGSFRQDAPVPA